MDKDTVSESKGRYIITILSLLCVALTAGLVTVSINSSNDKDILRDALSEKNEKIESLQTEKEEAEERYVRLQERVNPGREIWLPKKLTFAGQEVPLDNWYVQEAIREEVKAFTDLDANRELTEVIQRSRYWFPYTEQVIENQNSSEDIKYLCVQESRLNPIARSYRNAQGICQFMTNTAREHGLEVSWFVDERLLPEKAIAASVQYVESLREEFDGDIFLALAAYNAGASRVKGVIRRNDGNRNYFELGRLPYETEEFVYKIIAWKLILENPRKYYLNPVPDFSDRYPEVALVDTTLSQNANVTDLAQHYDIGYPEFKALNPHIKRNRVRNGEHTFRIPKSKR